MIENELTKQDLINLAAKELSAGKLIILPTETVTA